MFNHVRFGVETTAHASQKVLLEPRYNICLNKNDTKSSIVKRKENSPSLVTIAPFIRTQCTKKNPGGFAVSLPPPPPSDSNRVN